ncbi:hypothetical protein BKA65DRAFT_513824 [Rhexocercosporidium sp. MPI-PUGE-AT-0058]|nr:hypothetical protein BKA65DRAFT_513824 [Rhexocercosporidium sp. MPI-PUGE-AT-0058]
MLCGSPANSGHLFLQCGYAFFKHLVLILLRRGFHACIVCRHLCGDYIFVYNCFGSTVQFFYGVIKYNTLVSRKWPREFGALLLSGEHIGIEEQGPKYLSR